MTQRELDLKTLHAGPEIPPGWENDPIIKRLPQGDLMNVPDVAAAFGVSDNTVLAWIDTGDLPATDISSTDKPFWKLLRRDVIACRIKRHSMNRANVIPAKTKKGN